MWNRETGETPATSHLAGAAQNFPMALYVPLRTVFIATRKPAELICLDLGGKELARVPCVADSDDLYYDDVTNRVMVIGGGHRTGEPAATAPGSDAALDVFQWDEKEKRLSKIASVPTAPHARTGFFVPERHAIYIACPPVGTEDAKVLEFAVGK